MGPLVHAAHRDHLLEQIEAHGGECLQPSSSPDGPGWYLPPTLILGLAPEQTREELFGPVAFVLPFALALGLAPAGVEEDDEDEEDDDGTATA